MPEALTIGRLARAAGVNIQTVRYYQRRALVAQPASSKPVATAVANRSDVTLALI